MSEQQLINQMQSILQEKMERDYPKGQIKRDAHPKCLGLLTAKFRIDEHLPEYLYTSVFKPGKSYDALIRVSNASGKIQSDKKKDFRGFAIKLLDVSGKRFSSDEKQTQDFLLMSFPTMPLGTVKLFRDAVYYSIKVNPIVLLLKLIFTGKASVLKQLSQGKKFDTSPLDITYWSTTPYQFGSKQVKYKIVPTSKVKSTLPEKLTDNYLTQNMSKHLAKSPASFDFFVQCFENEKTTPIEDAAVEWKTPFIKVATLEIEPQEIDTRKRFELAEQLYFSLTNAVVEHAPLGGINRARTQIYSHLSQFRNKNNGKEMLEPTIKTIDEISG